MKRLLIISLAMAGCGGIQTDPTCKVEQYGLISIYNNTDEHKVAYLSRVVFDGERYRTVGPAQTREVPPLVEATFRVAPGMVLVVIDRIAGERWMKVFVVSICGNNRIRVDAPVVFRDLPLQSRRASQGCPPH